MIKNIDQISRIPLFAGLKSSELEKILKNARLENYKKNKNLFSQDEKILNFYIILQGSIKTFLINENGSETLISIAKDYDTICDIFSQNFEANGQFIKDSTILTIPIAAMREAAKNNLILALNFLNDAEKRNKNLFKQLSKIKTSDAKEKLGQFLLELAFANGNKKMQNIKLESSKEDLAALLAIKPETLSRNLKKLKKDQEISVKKNIIALTKKDSLCGYCNSEIAKKCSHNKEDFCQQK